MRQEMEIEIKGLEKLEAKMARLGRDALPMLEKAMDKAVLYTHGEVPDYPPAPVGSRYRRTHVMGNAITTEVKSVGSEVVGVIGVGEVAAYAPWVISSEAAPSGAGPQAWWHKRTGWYTLQGVVEKAKDAIIQIFDKAVDEWLKG